MTITIHQPNFFPWYPFFQKMQMADRFVILTHCQFRKNYFQNRFNINNKWYTMSVNKGLESISNKTYLNPHSDWDSIKNKLSQYRHILDQFDSCIQESLSETNSAIIKKICNLLSIKTEIVFDYPTDLSSTDRLVDLCDHYSAHTYIAGSGGANYMEVEKFEAKNIIIQTQTEDSKNKKPILEILNQL